MPVLLPLPPKPANRIKPANFTPGPGVTWDPALSEVRVENNQVMGVECGYNTPDLQDGDVYYKLLVAEFIDEPASQGRHNISVDVLDEEGRRLQGAKVWHGWPTHALPEYDARVEATVFGSNLATWDIYASYDAWRVVGPYWIQCADGPSDLFYGAGLPWSRHVSFALVFQRTVFGAQEPPVDPPADGQIVALLESIDANLRALRAHLGA